MVTFLRCDTVKVVGAIVDMVPSIKGRVRFGPVPRYGPLALKLVLVRLYCTRGQQEITDLTISAVAFFTDTRGIRLLFHKNLFSPIIGLNSYVILSD